jgi:hypothetical protein
VDLDPVQRRERLSGEQLIWSTQRSSTGARFKTTPSVRMLDARHGPGKCSATSGHPRGVLKTSGKGGHLTAGPHRDIDGTARPPAQPIQPADVRPRGDTAPTALENRPPPPRPNSPEVRAQTPRSRLAASPSCHRSAKSTDDHIQRGIGALPATGKTTVTISAVLTPVAARQNCLPS